MSSSSRMKQAFLEHKTPAKERYTPSQRALNSMKLIVNSGNRTVTVLTFGKLSHIDPPYGKSQDPLVAKLAVASCFLGFAGENIRQHFNIGENSPYAKFSCAVGRVENFLSAYLFPYSSAAYIMGTILTHGKNTKKEVDENRKIFAIVTSLLLIFPILQAIIDSKISSPDKEKDHKWLARGKDVLQIIQSASNVDFLVQSIEDLAKIPHSGNALELIIRDLLVLIIGSIIGIHANTVRHRIRNGEDKAEAHKEAHDLANDIVSAAGYMVTLINLILKTETVLFTPLGVLAGACLIAAAVCDAKPGEIDIDEVNFANVGSYAAPSADPVAAPVEEQGDKVVVSSDLEKGLSAQNSPPGEPEHEDFDDEPEERPSCFAKFLGHFVWKRPVDVEKDKRRAEAAAAAVSRSP